MIFPISWIAYVDIAVFALVVLFLLIGLYKGFLLMAVEFFSLIVTFVVSYFVSPILASQINLAANLEIDVGIPALNILVQERINDLLWFLLVFVVLMVVFAALRHVVKFVGEVPLIKQVNALLGGFFGILKSYLIVLLVIFVLTSPVVKNGNIVLQQTILGTIYQNSANVFTWFKEPTDFNQVLQDIINNKTIQESDLERFMEWFQTNVNGTIDRTAIESHIHIEEGE